MTGSVDQDETALNIPAEKVDKETMVEFLVSTGRIRKTLAEQLYDEGLDNWASLVNGDEAYFTGFKGVGKKTSEAFIELGQLKKEELMKIEEKPALADVLSGIPRVSFGVIDALSEKGYNSFSSFKDLEPEKLQELKGIGPKLSITIIEEVNNAMEKYQISDDEDVVIEDATGIMEEDTEEETSGDGSTEPGIFDKVVGWFKNIFSGSKDDEGSKEEETAQESPAPVQEKEAEPEKEDTPEPE
jgi:Holliday junction resolvasome RuvABC DNA-binding subunit